VHGTAFRSAGRYVGGEVGAERLLDGDGRAFALKRQPPGFAPLVTERLRERGYPAPHYVVVAETYSVQEELPGAPLGGWDVPFTARLLELNDLQEGCAIGTDRSWPATIVESVLEGFEEFMVLETLERHSDEGRELLACCRSAVERHAHLLTTNDDIAHMDFTADNVLALDGEITGVIDWGGARSGDRAFDLATWSYYAPSDAALRATVVERIGEKGLSVYLAHMAIRQADWSIRHHGEGAGWQTVRYGLQLARAFP
jgi:Phosphotransferase enzyme family